MNTSEMNTSEMNTSERLSKIRSLYNSAPIYSDEIGRYVGKSGASYPAWHNGRARKIDVDADSRRYGEEGDEFFFWK